jgi:hypothetical protein
LCTFDDEAGNALRVFRLDDEPHFGPVVALEQLVQVIPGRRLVAVEGRGIDVLVHAGRWWFAKRLRTARCLVVTDRRVLAGVIVKLL